MESVESIAGKIAHEDLVYLDHSPPVYQQVDRMALERSIAAALAAERAKFAAFADEKGEPRKVLGYKPSPLVPLAEFVRLAELLDDYAMGGNRVSTTLPDIVAQMNHTANTARLHM